jgi:hypothetical protein
MRRQAIFHMDFLQKDDFWHLFFVIILQKGVTPMPKTVLIKVKAFHYGQKGDGRLG